MRVADVDERALALDGVRRSDRDGLAQWRFHGRLVARQLDADHLVVRCDLDLRDDLVRQDPATFSVPPRFERHTMVVVDLAAADPGAVEDALVAAWRLQQAGDDPRGRG